MNKIYFRVVLVLFMMLVSLAGYAQNKKSNEIIIDNGKKYYKHIVAKGETLSSIAQLYAVSEKTITDLNPQALMGFRFGEPLKIPVLGNIESSIDKTPDFLEHVVEKKQTLYSISKMYNVTVDEITKHNPQATGELKAGLKLKIPKKKGVVSREVENKIFLGEDDDFIYYKVKQKESLYSVSQQFGISVADIQKANPLVKDNVKKDETIKIPKPKKVEQIIDKEIVKTEKKVENVITNDPLFFENPTEKVQAINYEQNPIVFNVALLFPFKLDENDKTNQAAFFGYTKKVLEFYGGILMAADTLRKMGLQAQFFVYDTQADSTAVRKTLQLPEMKKMNLILGPLYPNAMSPASNFSKENRIPMVSPLFFNNSVDKKYDFASINPYFFQAEPSIESRISQIAQQIAETGSRKVVVINNLKADETNLTEADKEEMALVKLYRDKFNQVFSEKGKIDKLQYVEVNYKTSKLDGVKKELSESEETVVIVASSNIKFIVGLVPSLNNLSKKYNLSVYSTEEWEKYDIDVEQLNNLKMQYSTSTFVDYSTNEVKTFIRKYRITFNTEPSYLSFKGYDLTMYFLTVMKTYGINIQAVMNSKFNAPQKGLSTSFSFKRVQQLGGFENQNINIVKYDKELNVIKIK